MIPKILYQVRAIDVATDRQIFVGPAMSHPKMLHELAAAINKGAATGAEKRWRDAQVTQLPNTRSH